MIQDPEHCAVEITYTDYSGIPGAKKLADVDCGDLRGFLTKVSAD